MQRKFLVCSVIYVLAALFAVTGVAQEQKTVYTQLGLWDVPRAKWGDFARSIEQYEKPIMEKLVAEGLIIEWGFDAAGVHSPEGYSHSTWTSAYSMADLEKAGDRYFEALGEQGEALEAELDSMLNKHADVYARSIHYGSRPSNLSGGFAFGTRTRVRRGKGPEFREMWEECAKPIYDALLAEGTIVAYNVGTDYIHSTADSLGSTWTWYILENLEADEKVEAAFEAARNALGKADRAARQHYFWSLIEKESHRDDFTRVHHFVTR